MMPNYSDADYENTDDNKMTHVRNSSLTSSPGGMPSLTRQAEIVTPSGNASSSAPNTSGRILRQRPQQNPKNQQNRGNRDDDISMVQPPPDIRGVLFDRNDPNYIFNFIRKVKTVPMLYNQKDEKFRNLALKAQTWQQIAVEFDTDVNWVQRKWISLRDYFVKRKKLHQMGRPARPWVYYKELKFLDAIYGDDNVSVDVEPTVPTSPKKKTRKSKEESDLKSESVTYTLSEDLLYHNEASNSLSNSALEYEQDGYENENYDDEDIEILEDSHEYKYSNLSLVTGEEEESPSGYYSTHSLPVKRPKLDVFTHPLTITNNTSNISQNNSNISRREHLNAEAIVNFGTEEKSNDKVLPSSAVEAHYPVSQSRDAYDLFCLSVAVQLRNMPRAKALQTQVKIMELMYDSEFPQQQQYTHSSK